MKRSYLFTFIAIFFWSTMSVTVKLLVTGRENMQVLWISSFFAALSLFVFNYIKGNLKKLKSYTGKDWLISVLIGLPGIFFYNIFLYSGTSMMPASQANIVNYLWPIMCVVFACIILKEKVTLRKVLAIIISFIGICIVMGDSFTHFDSKILLGAVCCSLGAVCYGIFTALNKKYDYDKNLSMLINYVVVFVITSVINAISGDLFIPTAAEFFGFIWNGVFVLAVANTAWMYAVSSSNTAKVANLAYITPFISLVWTTVILHEAFKINYLLGLVVIILGIFIQLKDKNPENN